MNEKKSVLLSLLLMLSPACDKGGETQPPEPPPGETTFFQSGFEDGVTVEDTGLAKCSGDIFGTDGSERGDWEAHLETSPVDKVVFCYGGDDDYAAEGGALGQRGIELVDDPDQPGNTVLHTWVAEPAENYGDQDADDVACSCVGGLDETGATCEDLPEDPDGNPLDGYDEDGTRKGRVQMAIYADDGTPFSSFSYSVRLRLGEGYERINNDLPQKLNWMTIGEFWNQGPATLGIGDRSRVTLNLVKESASAPLHFGLKMDIQPDGGSGWDLIWPEKEAPSDPEHMVSDNPVPVGEWFTLKVSVVAGDASTGRTTVDVVYANGDEERIFEVTDATIYPGTSVPGFTTLAPVKLYTGGNLVCWLKSLGLPMDAHWDDFSLSLLTEQR